MTTLDSRNEDSESNKEESIHKQSVTFRLDANVMAKLQQESKQKQISLNTLVNQITRQHTDWHFTASQAGFITVRKGLIMRLLNLTEDDETIKQIAKEVAKGSNKDFLLLLKKQYNIQSALDFIESWLRVSGYPYSHDISQGNYPKRHYFVIQHDMGLKWSKYLAALYSNLVEEFGIYDKNFDMTDNTLVFTINIESKKHQ